MCTYNHCFVYFIFVKINRIYICLCIPKNKILKKWYFKLNNLTCGSVIKKLNLKYKTKGNVLD